ncbi:MAG: ion transporter [Planctomycetes bacterium]|nr:ion transporter [Planctomycetota bacterium]
MPDPSFPRSASKVAPAPPSQKDRLGAWVYSQGVSLTIVFLIVVSVSLVFLQVLLPHDHPWQHPSEVVQLVITGVFVVELSLKAYVAQSRWQFLTHYWIDLIAIIPWVQALRVLRILRILRVFRVAIILSRRVRWVSLLLRSAVGEYVVLGLILVVFVVTGSVALYHAESEARVDAAVARSGIDPGDEPQLDEPENAFWATLFFLVATEPMISVPKTTIGKLVTLVIMFGGLTTFAVFTGIVTALMVNRLKRRLEINEMDRFQLTKHLLICGWNNQVPLVIEEILAAHHSRGLAVVVIADLPEAPTEIQAQGDTGRVFFVPGDYTKPNVLDQARVRYAERALVVADSTLPRSDQDRDARTVLAALMIERMNPQIYTAAELLNRDNEQHLRAAGIEEVITTSEAGGHHLAMAALHSGLSQVVGELLTVKVGQGLQKFRVPAEYVGLPFSHALEQCKRDRDALLIGVEVFGQDGPRTPGYAMLVNPDLTVVIGARDNLILIATTATPLT